MCIQLLDQGLKTVIISLRWYYVKLIGSHFNIIAKCCSIINYGSITNSSLVNGIMNISAKLLGNNSLKSHTHTKSLRHPQAVKEITFFLPDHL